MKNSSCIKASIIVNTARRMRTLLIAVSAVLVAVSAYAQDVVQVAGDSHKVILDNAQVRVLAVTLKPGQKAPMHSHPANVSYVLSDGKLRITLPDGKTMDKEPKAGAATWSDAVTHAVENVGTSDFTQVQIELKNAAPAK